MFQLKIRIEDDAFQPDPRPEVARILVALAERIENGEDFGVFRTVFDINGNDVGRARLRPDSEER